MTTRRQFLASTTAAITPVRAAKTRPPNILLIIADEWRAQATSWNGDRNVATPALDRFAAYYNEVRPHRSQREEELSR